MPKKKLVTNWSLPFFGSGKRRAKKAPAKRRKASTVGAAQALDAALKAGKRAGDTGAFGAWLKKARLDGRGWFLKSRLRSEFEKGVDAGINERQAKKVRKSAGRKSVLGAARGRKVDGYRVWQSAPGVWRSKLDPDSEFESYKEAAAFTRSMVKARTNPRRVGNPLCGGWKPVDQITDRAKRYRANHEDCKPPGPRRCLFCGSGKNVDVHHLDGNESHGGRQNLVYACRSCNTAIGAAMKRKGLGKRTRQFNPQHVPTYGEYVAAVAAHRRGAWDAGGKVIHATPAHIRREYAARIWERRKERGSVPF